MKWPAFKAALVTRLLHNCCFQSSSQSIKSSCWGPLTVCIKAYMQLWIEIPSRIKSSHTKIISRQSEYGEVWCNT